MGDKMVPYLSLVLFACWLSSCGLVSGQVLYPKKRGGALSMPTPQPMTLPYNWADLRKREPPPPPTPPTRKPMPTPDVHRGGASSPQSFVQACSEDRQLLCANRGDVPVCLVQNFAKLTTEYCRQWIEAYKACSVDVAEAGCKHTLMTCLVEAVGPDQLSEKCKATALYKAAHMRRALMNRRH